MWNGLFPISLVQTVQYMVLLYCLCSDSAFWIEPLLDTQEKVKFPFETSQIWNCQAEMHVVWMYKICEVVCTKWIPKILEVLIDFFQSERDLFRSSAASVKYWCIILRGLIQCTTDPKHADFEMPHLQMSAICQPVSSKDFQRSANNVLCVSARL